MESDVGKCWTCGKRSAAFECAECRFAAYCSPECQESDRNRHRSECRVSVKSQFCTKCNSRLSVSRCNFCHYALFCRRCKSWNSKTHKEKCSSVLYAASDAAMLVGMTPPRQWTRLTGHAQAEDYLRLRQNEGKNCERHLRLLFLGVGYMRDVIRTVSDVPSEFGGQLSFVLNDISPHVIARDLLLLYCAVVHPQVEHLVQIWHSVFLLPECLVYLVKMLKELVHTPRNEILERMRGLVEVNCRHWQKCVRIWKVMRKVALDPDAAEKMAAIRWRMTEVAVPYRQEVVMKVLRIPEEHHQSVMDLLDNGVLLPVDDPKRKVAVFPNATLIGAETFSKREEEEEDDDAADHLMLSLSTKTETAAAEKISFTDDMARDACGRSNRKSSRVKKRCCGSTVNKSLTCRSSYALAWGKLCWLKHFPKRDTYARLVLETSCVFHCWDYWSVVGETAGDKMDDLLDMYRSYLTTVFRSFVEKLATERVKFQLVVCHCMNVDKYISPTDKFDRIRVTNLSDHFTYPLFLKHFGHRLNRDNEHSVLVTLHERWVMLRASVPHTLLCSTYPEVAAQLLSVRTKDPSLNRTQTYREEFPYVDAAPMFYRSLLADHLCYLNDNVQSQPRPGSARVSDDRMIRLVANLTPPDRVATTFNLHLRDYNTSLNRVVPFRREPGGRIQACNGKRYLEWTVSAPPTPADD